MSNIRTGRMLISLAVMQLVATLTLLPHTSSAMPRNDKQQDNSKAHSSIASTLLCCFKSPTSPDDLNSPYVAAASSSNTECNPAAQTEHRKAAPVDRYKLTRTEENRVSKCSSPVRTTTGILGLDHPQSQQALNRTELKMNTSMSSLFARPARAIDVRYHSADFVAVMSDRSDEKHLKLNHLLSKTIHDDLLKYVPQSQLRSKEQMVAFFEQAEDSGAFVNAWITNMLANYVARYSAMSDQEKRDEQQAVAQEKETKVLKRVLKRADEMLPKESVKEEAALKLREHTTNEAKRRQDIYKENKRRETIDKLCLRIASLWTGVHGHNSLKQRRLNPVKGMASSLILNSINWILHISDKDRDLLTQTLSREYGGIFRVHDPAFALQVRDVVEARMAQASMIVDKLSAALDTDVIIQIPDVAVETSPTMSDGLLKKTFCDLGAFLAFLIKVSRKQAVTDADMDSVAMIGRSLILTLMTRLQTVKE
eukprot:GHVQ01041681.1.p1 GENE.GHVQ01041681.1~~GHVQ01041681.1.p1  ORF type:complete len:481 (+),score=68.69 GHVQ01041681.1:202-1644(+)